jgi:death-on-curing protein
MKYLHYKQCLFIYYRIIQRSGGTGGLRDEGLLRAALARPKMRFAGEELYPTVFEKAAVLGLSLIKKSPFSDNNKRVAFEAMDITLRLNGYRLIAEGEERYRLISEMAEGRLDEAKIAEQLKKGSKKLTDLCYSGIMKDDEEMDPCFGSNNWS